MDEYLVVRAALRDELSRPMAEVRRLIRETARETRTLSREQEAGARSAARYEAAMGRVSRAQGLVTGALKTTAKVGVVALGGALAGLAVMTAKVGGDYRATMNEFGAVTGATSAQLRDVGAAAKELGSATDLAGVSAADAAAVMTELAKGGLSVEDAMAAAKGTLQLAGAAQIDAATAATIQAAALNQFSLSGKEAGRVADVLANTANAAAGGVEDIGLALSYAGPVAASLSESIEGTAAAIGLLSNAGIGGEKAGTALRAILAGLAAPSKQSARGLDELGITAFDAQGRFVGLRSITEQLSAAQGRLNEQQFASAAATAFGREPLAAVVALAEAGAPAYDAMATAVGRAGGAAEVAAAKTKGLRGALENVQSQLETVGIEIYERLEPGLERAVRSAAAQIDPLAERGFELVDAVPWERVGGDLAAGFQVARTTLRPVADGLAAVGGEVRDLTETATTGGTALNTVLVTLGTVAQAGAGGLGLVLNVAAGALDLFQKLPGSIQAVVVGLIAMSTVQPILHRHLSTTVDGVRNAGTGIRNFGEQMRVQQALAAANGQQIGNLSAAYSTLVARTGGLRGVGSALLGAVGGPVGLAITGATIGLSLLASAHAKAQAKVAENAAAQRSYADALEVSNGAIDEQVVKMATTRLQDAGAFDNARGLGIGLDAVTDAALKGGAASSTLIKQLRDAASASRALTSAQGEGRTGDAAAIRERMKMIGLELDPRRAGMAERLADALEVETANVAAGTKAYEEQAAVRRALGFSEGLSVANTGKLGEAIGVLGDASADAASKTNALRTAVDLLQGREVDLTTVQANMYEQLDALKSSGADFSKVLDAATGSVNVQEAAGRTLNTTLTSYRDQMSAATLAAYQNARAQGQDLPAAYAAATAAGDTARGALVDQLSQMGLNAEQANALADKYGLLTGDFVATIRTNVDPAEAALAAFQERWTKTPFIVQAQVRTTGIPFKNTTPAATPAPSAAAGVPGITKKADGGLVEFYAAGGLRPMRGGVADVVAPGTWRVIGDRAVDDEAYIPVNRSARSLAILEETATRMGRAVVPLRRFAEGGLALAAPPAPMPSGGGGDSITVQISIDGARDAAAIAREVEARVPGIVAAIQLEMKERR